MKKTMGLFFMGMTLLLSSCGYNSIIANEEAVNEAMGNVQAAYQKRADLIPNLVNTVKGYAAHEEETLTAVVNARAKATSMQLTPEMLENEQQMQNFQNAQNQLNSSLSRLMMVVENYPELKANENFSSLQRQLESIENSINTARNRYNETIRVFNTSIRIFPQNITNNFFLKLKPKTAFTAAPEASEAPKVIF